MVGGCTGGAERNHGVLTRDELGSHRSCKVCNGESRGVGNGGAVNPCWVKEDETGQSKFLDFKLAGAGAVADADIACTGEFAKLESGTVGYSNIGTFNSRHLCNVKGAGLYRECALVGDGNGLVQRSDRSFIKTENQFGSIRRVADSQLEVFSEGAFNERLGFAVKAAGDGQSALFESNFSRGIGGAFRCFNLDGTDGGGVAVGDRDNGAGCATS